MNQDESKRTIGLFGATSVGVGAIVGGGILVLGGVAFAAAGPAAILAFAINGAVAFLTAMSFAEMSSSFPQSGGAYTFAKKVLSVRAAFVVGWIIWFAYIVAGVLYALGFASYAALLISSLLSLVDIGTPEWIAGRRLALLLATIATIAYAVSLIRKEAGGGQWATPGKVIVFAILIVVGAVVLIGQPLTITREKLDPFMPGGISGLIMAMGFTFIALQGFDLVAAVAGGVKSPSRNIPKAMFLSLGLALTIYIPLLLIVATVGTTPGSSIAELATSQPETIIAVAADNFMGPIGYWLVIIAAILSTLSALHANLLAASQVALSMAGDRTLPSVLRQHHKTRKTPAMAVYASALTLVAILFMVPDLAAAGAAASLIFLMSFALAHVTAYLARVRGGPRTGVYQTPWFPVVPVVGGVACAALALFQAVAVPDAGGIVLVWLGLGVILYLSLFARRAEAYDASAEALDPDLIRLRGRSPLVLLPVANPATAKALIGVANALVPTRVGRVLLLTIVPVDSEKSPQDVVKGLDSAQAVVREALTSSYAAGHVPEALITAAPEPWAEIQRIAAIHTCESLLLGIGPIREDRAQLEPIERLINRVDSDIAIVRSPEGWILDDAVKILIPIGGRGEQHELRARLLGSLCRAKTRELHFLQVIAENASEQEVKETRKAVERLTELKSPGEHSVHVIRSNSPTDTIVEFAKDCDLVVLGLRQVGGLKYVSDLSRMSNVRTVGRTSRAIGDFAIEITRRAPCATIMLSRKL